MLSAFQQAGHGIPSDATYHHRAHKAALEATSNAITGSFILGFQALMVFVDSMHCKKRCVVPSRYIYVRFVFPFC